MSRKRAALAQNFFRRPATVGELVRMTGIGPGDRVYDLGAGSGAISAALCRTGAEVIAVETDPNLLRKLRLRFGISVQVMDADLTQMQFAPPYKVVASPPFNRTADTLRRLYFFAAAPDDAWLVLQREAAEKYATRPTALALMLRPWFEATIARGFAAEDFVPQPRVGVVLLRILRRPSPALADCERASWNSFVRYAFGRARPGARQSFRALLSGLQWRLLCRDLGIEEGAMLSDLTSAQWLGLYRFVRGSIPAAKARRVVG